MGDSAMTFSGQGAQATDPKGKGKGKAVEHHEEDVSMGEGDDVSSDESVHDDVSQTCFVVGCSGLPANQTRILDH
jgi:hypothetical protein